MTREPGDLPSHCKAEAGRGALASESGLRWALIRHRVGVHPDNLANGRGVQCVDVSTNPEDEIATMQAATVTIVVCESCRDETGSEAYPRAGESLAADALRAAEGSGVKVATVSCLGNCKRRLSAAIVKPGAWSYVFGDLAMDSGADLVAGATLFAASTDGLIPWRGRPDSLKRGLVARIPPLDLAKETK